jgi:hypothetical protein
MTGKMRSSDLTREVDFVCVNSVVRKKRAWRDES